VRTGLSDEALVGNRLDQMALAERKEGPKKCN
jgi:hypothetical protein